MRMFVGGLVVLVLGTVGFVILEPAPALPPTEDPRFAERHYNRLETDWNDYIWPTDASDAKTSSFCEFRKTHFHAGIDISTNMKTGYNTLASRAGWLHSIDFQPGGYGWFLVLRHYDGYYTCYAHLDGFPEHIEGAYINKLSAMNKSFGLAEWAKDEVVFKKGDVIAYTGATGAGPPHLHFEIRDRDFNPVNPELAPNIRVTDTKPPEFLEAAFVPLDTRSTVNGAYAMKILSVKRVNDTLFRLPETPVLSGRIGVQVKALDGAEGFKDVETPYNLTTILNGRRHFDVSFDRIQEDHGWFIRLDRNNDLMLSRRGEFRKLYREPGNTLAVYLPNEPWGGMLSSETALAGINTYRIKATDLSGNSASLHGSFAMQPEVTLSLSASSVSVVTVTCASPAPGVFVEMLRFGEKGTARQRHPITAAETHVRWSLPDSSAVYEVRAVDSVGNILRRAYCSRLIRGGASLDGSYTVSGGDVVAELRSTVPMNLPPVITLHSASGSVRMHLESLAPNRYRASLSIPDHLKPPFRIEAQSLLGGVLRKWTQPIHECYITPSGGGIVQSDDTLCRVEFGPAAVPQPGFYSLQTLAIADRTVYALSPSNTPLTGALSVSLKPSAPHDGKNYIEARNPASFLRFGTLPYDGASPWVTGSFGRYPAEYRLMRDTIAPRISVITRRGRLPLIRIADAESGLNLQSVLVRAGKRIVPLFYSEAQSGFEIPASYLKQHKLGNIVITASDRVGNFSVSEARL